VTHKGSNGHARRTRSVLCYARWTETRAQRDPWQLRGVFEEFRRWHGGRPSVGSRSMYLTTRRFRSDVVGPKGRSLDPYEQLLRDPRPVRSVGFRHCRWSLWVSVRHRWLDYLLAHGVSPETSRSLTLRAHQLTGRPMRERLATSVGVLLSGSSWRQRWGLALAPECVCVEAARAELEAIKEILTGESPVYARGVATTRELLGSPASPLFDAHKAESARYLADLSVSALKGHT
jgi:hypothetical protein